MSAVVRLALTTVFLWYTAYHAHWSVVLGLITLSVSNELSAYLHGGLMRRVKDVEIQVGLLQEHAR